MKRNQAITMYQAILSIRLNKMSEEMTDAVLANTLELAEVNSAFGKIQEELRKRTIEAVDKDRRSAYDEMVTKKEALDGARRAAVQAVINDNYKDVLHAVQSYTKAVSRWLGKEASIKLQQVDRKGFIKAVKDAEQTLTPADIEVLAPLFKGYENPKDADFSELDELLKD